MKRILRVIIAIVGIILVISGLLGIIPPGISGKFYSINISNSIPGNIILDSNYRFYAGLSIGLGLVLFWIIPSVEKQKVILRLITFIIFMGGLGRVISMITFGIPPTLFIIFTIFELLFPLIIILQNKAVKQ